MNAFFNSRRTRLTATVMVLVWLITVGMGIANACVIHQDEALHGHPASASHAVVHQHEADRHTMSPNALACLSFCTAEQSTLVKGKVQCDSPQAVDLAPVPLLVGLLLPRVEPVVQPRPVRCSRCSDPPVSIRFSRLTI